MLTIEIYITIENSILFSLIKSLAFSSSKSLQMRKFLPRFIYHGENLSAKAMQVVLPKQVQSPPTIRKLSVLFVCVISHIAIVSRSTTVSNSVQKKSSQKNPFKIFESAC